jgi:hypothetical protein
MSEREYITKRDLSTIFDRIDNQTLDYIEREQFRVKRVLKELNMDRMEAIRNYYANTALLQNEGYSR